MNLNQQLEAILFWKAEPMTVAELAKATGADKDGVLIALGELETALLGQGIVLMRKDDEIALGTAPELSDLMERLAKEELSHELSKATLETLSIILYKGPVSRAEIDYIRGVQSAFMLRQLLVRGLIERIDNPKDQRSFLYRPSFDLLAHLGVAKIEDLPEYVEVQKELTSFVAAKPVVENQRIDKDLEKTIKIEHQEE
ncbi:MAG: SMC-Scp complex subunit ScpB [Candidatus Paceibacterota bacterium]|jgi:segregation and condensation protein B